MALPKANEIVWPPQTTQDVLNLTPRKSRQVLNPPTSPSPLRKSTQPSQLDPGGSNEDDVTTDDDEETLQLQLARIEAKLRIKKLQKKKAAAAKVDASPPKVQVPASPSSKSSAAQPPPSPKSPSRIILGIDKGLTGRDVSLRRAPQYRKPPTATMTRAPSPKRPTKSFSERIAEQRTKDRTTAERRKAIEASRSAGFGLETVQQATHTFTSVLNGVQGPPPGPTQPLKLSPADPFVDRDSESTDEAGFDSYSGFHLIKRTSPHNIVSRHLSSKTIYQLPQLLKEVISPHYDPPDVEGDWVTLGIICSKTDPRNVGQNTKTKPNGQKYMVLQLTDLKWEIELFLFGAGFERFWKLPIGTVIGVLNPGIMKPRNADTGKFSLTLADSASDSILEIGFSRDLAFCKSTKRDGKPCASWVDKRHTHFCAFHVEQTVKKTRVGRAEINSMSSLFSPPKKAGGVKPKRFFGKTGAGGGGGERDDGLLREGPIADLPTRLGGAGGSVYVAPGRSTAALLDDEDYLADGFHRGTREERLRKRLADGKKERELTKRIIASQGRDGGMGAQYLRKRIGETDEDGKERGRKPEDAKEVSQALAALLPGPERNAAGVRLSPIKRKRPEAPILMSAMRKTGEPVAKKTRFAVEGASGDDSSDDGLDIVHG